MGGLSIPAVAGILILAIFFRKPIGKILKFFISLLLIKILFGAGVLIALIWSVSTLWG